MISSTMAFACMNATVKYLTHLSAFQIVFFRSVGSLFFTFGFLLKHKIPVLGNQRKLLVLRGLVGVTSMAVLKGFDNNAALSAYGLVLITVSAIFSGLVYVVISKIGKGDHPVVIVNYFMVISTLVGAIFCIRDWVNPQGIEWLMLSSLGVFGYFGQIFMTKAFQMASTNQVAPLKYLEVIFTLLFGVFLFSEIYTMYSILGIAMIICGLLLNALYKGKK